jgi:hypothetical protein
LSGFQSPAVEPCIPRSQPRRLQPAVWSFWHANGACLVPHQRCQPIHKQRGLHGCSSI